jgi:ParB family transcriptional regulator, chromosome partitioning protein
MTTTETTAVTDPATETAIVLLDPNVLAAHPANVRKNLRDLRGMVRSIKGMGIVVPLVVIPTDDGGHRIVAGHRRCAAAIEAGLSEVPCLVRSDLDDAKQVAAMLVENTQREALTGAEEAAGYEQLAVLGLTDSGIAKATGVTRRHVQQARRVATSEVASTVAEHYDLTLAQALVIAEFDDDRDAVKHLAVTAAKDPGQFEHVASRLRQDRAREAQRQATTEALVAAGVTVLPDADRYNNHPRAASLRDLADAEGTPLTPEDHADCPGHLAVVKEWEPTDVAYYCLDPRKHGHRSRYSSGRVKGAAMSEEDKAARRRVIENNKAWKAAQPVRRQFVTELLARKKPPAGTLRYAVGEVLTEPDRVGDADDKLLAELTGVEIPRGDDRRVGPGYLAKLSDARLPAGLLAQVAADNEHAMGVHTWRNPARRATRWLSFLISVGYGPSDIEQHVIDQATPDTQPDTGVGEHPSEPAETVHNVVPISAHQARTDPTGETEGEPAAPHSEPGDSADEATDPDAS